MNLREWLLSEQGGRRRIDRLLGVLGATDFWVAGRTPHEVTMTGDCIPEQRRALADRLRALCPGVWEGLGAVEPPIFTPFDPVEAVLLNDLTVAILDTRWTRFPTEADPRAEDGAVQGLVDYLVRVIY